jgi:hypothetical protein
MPKARRAVVDLLTGAAPGVLWTSAQVADACGLPTQVAGRTLEDLTAHGVLERHSDGRLHRWGPSEWLRVRWAELQLPVRSGGKPCPVEAEAGW